MRLSRAARSTKQLFVVVVSMLPTMAFAQDAALLRTCNGTDRQASVSACTQLLGSSLDAASRSRILFNRGVRYQSGGEIDKAISDFSEPIRIDPSSALSLSARGVAYIRKEHFDAARKDIDASIRLRPDLAEAYTARSLLNLNSGRLDESIADASKALSLDPKQQAAYNNRGAAYREKGNYERAIEDFNVVVRLNPAASRPLYNRGLVYMRRGEMDRALADYDASLALNPADGDAQAARNAILDARKAQTSSNDQAFQQVQSDSTIKDPGCDSLKSLRFDGPPSDRDLRVFGKPLRDWNSGDTSKFRRIVDACRSEIRSVANYPQKLYEKEIERYVAWIGQSTEQLVSRAVASAKGRAVVLEAKELAGKVNRQEATQADVDRLTAMISGARGLSSEYTRNGDSDLGLELAKTVEAAENALRIYKNQTETKRLAEESRKRETEEREMTQREQAFLDSIPSCKKAYAALRNSANAPGAENAFSLFAAGESANACRLMTKLLREMDSARLDHISCSKDLSASSDPFAKEAAQNAMTTAVGINLNLDKIARSIQEMHCDSPR